MYMPTKLLARGDIILVVIHYRLGVLGMSEAEVLRYFIL